MSALPDRRLVFSDLWCTSERTLTLAPFVGPGDPEPADLTEEAQVRKIDVAIKEAMASHRGAGRQIRQATTPLRREVGRLRQVVAGLRQDVMALKDAYNLPYADGAFDRTLSMLTLDVLAEPGRVIGEMRRVTRRGGTVAGLVNDFRCGYTAFSLVLDTAAPLEPSAGALRDEAMSDPKGWPDGLARLFREAGPGGVREGRLTMFFEFESFADYWGTFTTGRGRWGRWLMGLTESQRSLIERHIRPAYLCGRPDGPRPFSTTCWVARGVIA